MSNVALEKGKITSKWTLAGLALILPTTVLIIWQVLGDYGYISDLLFPTPYTIGASAVALAASGELWQHIQVSVLRAMAGYALGGGLGLAFGIIVGQFRRAEKTLDPTIQMIRMIPSLAIIPLFILWFGIGEESKVLIIAKSAFFPLYINTFLGIRNVDNKLYEVARVLQFSPLKVITRLTIPAALPNIILGARLSAGLSWLGLVVAELIASTSGIGYMMSDARQFADTPVVFVGIFLFAILGLVTDALLTLFERRLLRWKDRFNGER